MLTTSVAQGRKRMAMVDEVEEWWMDRPAFTFLCSGAPGWDGFSSSKGALGRWSSLLWSHSAWWVTKVGDATLQLQDGTGRRAQGYARHVLGSTGFQHVWNATQGARGDPSSS
jgi:hypothetical protein